MGFLNKKRFYQGLSILTFLLASYIIAEAQVVLIPQFRGIVVKRQGINGKAKVWLRITFLRSAEVPLPITTPLNPPPSFSCVLRASSTGAEMNSLWSISNWQWQPGQGPLEIDADLNYAHKGSSNPFYTFEMKINNVQDYSFPKGMNNTWGGKIIVRKTPGNAFVFRFFRKIGSFIYGVTFRDLLVSGNRAFGIIFVIIFSLFAIILILSFLYMFSRVDIGIVPIQKMRLVPKPKRYFSWKKEIRHILWSYRGYLKNHIFANEIRNILYDTSKDGSEKRKSIHELLSDNKKYFDSPRKSVLGKAIEMLVNTIESHSLWPGHLNRIYDSRLDSEVKVTYSNIIGVNGISRKGVDFENIFNLETFWILGVVAPLIGLFGTVIGISGAFGQISFKSFFTYIQNIIAGGANFGQLSTELAGNIRIALQTTMLGLFIGISSLMSYYYFRMKIDSFLEEMENFLIEIKNPLLNK